MIITCPHCSFSKSVEDELIPVAGVSVGCPRCRKSFPVQREMPAAGEADSLPNCPSCKYQLPSVPGCTTCPRCGLIFAKYRPPPTPETVPDPVAMETAGATGQVGLRGGFAVAWQVAKFLLPVFALVAAAVIYYHPSLLVRANLYLQSMREHKEPPPYWIRTVGGLQGSTTALSAAVLPDGSLVLAGEGEGLGVFPGVSGLLSKNLLVRLDPNGSIRWSRVYEFVQYTRVTKVCATSDGGFALALHGMPDGGIAKFDGNGVLVWRFTALLTSIQDVSATRDGGIAFIGTRTDGTGQYLWAGKLNALGAPEWTAGLGEGMGASIEEGADRGFIVSASMSSGSFRDMRLIKLDSSGAPQWRRTFENAVETCFARNLKDGGYLVAGSMQHRPYYFDAGGEPTTIAFLLRLDAQGEVVWHNLYGTSGDNSFTGIRENDDGSLLAVGRRVVFEKTVSASVTLSRFDVDGGILWQKGFGARKNGIGATDLFCSNDALLLVGSTLDYGPYWKMLVIKLLKDGGIPVGLESALQAAPDYAARPFALQMEELQNVEGVGNAGAPFSGGKLPHTLGSQEVTVFSKLVAPPVPSVGVAINRRRVSNSRGVIGVQISNVGSASLSVSKISLEGGDANLFELSGTCSHIAPEDTCNVSIKYQRIDKSADLVIFSDDPEQPVLILPLGNALR